MKRDLDLIRKIMLAAEAMPTSWFMDVEVPDVPEDRLKYHKYLILQEGFAEGEEESPMGTSDLGASLHSITWAGHEFLDDIRDETIWGKVKARLGDTAPTASIAVVKALATMLVKERLGLG